MIWDYLCGLIADPLRELLLRITKRGLMTPEERLQNVEANKEENKEAARAEWDEQKEDYDTFRKGGQ